ncbi:type I restriction-modification system subunit R [Pseudomonas fluorescens]|nr:type I restriction-modification system subunit R [Pseudomonas fluorescens]
MDKKSLSKRDICSKYIAPAIQQSGWDMHKQVREEVSFTKGRIMVRGKLHSRGDLAADFQADFGLPLDEEALNQSHQIIIVASGLDASTERIVAYLSERDIAINVLCFQVFQQGAQQLISRSWLLDPVETQANASNTRSDGPS